MRPEVSEEPVLERPSIFVQTPKNETYPGIRSLLRWGHRGTGFKITPKI
jgi:hypothetical protein